MSKEKNEIEALEAENKALKTRISELESLIPKQLTAKEGHAIVFVKSENVAYTKKGDGKYINVSVSGTNPDGSFFHMDHDVLCDRQVEVPKPIADALKGVIEAQRA